jgi:hypothetical protein
MIRFAISLQAVVFLSAGTPAFAANDTSPDALIQQGLDLRRDGKPDQALEMFQRAHEMAPSPRTFGQMGLVETSLKRWVDADMHLSVSLTTPDDAWVAKNRAFLEQALETSKQHVGDLVVTGPAGAEVFVGGKSVGTLPAVPPVHLAEGSISVSATAPGFKPFDQTLVIRPGVRTPLAIALVPITVEPAAAVATAAPAPSLSLMSPEAAKPTHGRWHTWAGASLAVAGAGVLTWGIVWIAIDNHDACGSLHGSACVTAYDTKTAGWILAGAGTATLVGGALVFFTGHEQAPASAVTVGLGPSSFILSGFF